MATLATLLALTGCGRNPVPQQGAVQPSAASADVAAARDLLGKAQNRVIQLGRAGGPTGSAATSAVAEAEASLTSARAKTGSAKLALATAPDVEAQQSVVALERALGLFESALPLGRALAIEDAPCQLAIGGWNKLAAAIPLGNSDEYAKALVLAKQARAQLLAAERALEAPAKAYPGTPSIKNMYLWCVEARRLADIEIKMNTAGQKGRVAAYNKLVASFNAQKNLVSSKPDPGKEWNRLNDEWRAAYNKAAEVVSALE